MSTGICKLDNNNSKRVSSMSNSKEILSTTKPKIRIRPAKEGNVSKERDI